MQIGVVDMNLAMTRTQDLIAAKHAADNKGNVDHSVFQQAVDRQSEQKASTVQGPSETQTQSSLDASGQGGGNEYAGDGGAQRRQKREQKEGEDIPLEGRVIRKAASHINFKA